MKSLCLSEEEKKALARLESLIADGKVTGTVAWKLFASPAAKHEVGPKKEIHAFTDDEINSYSSIRKRTSKTLYERFRMACAYCRRSVGHYGYGWHIEHVYAKAHYPSRTFELSNLTIGCVDCNRWKGVRVDRQAHGKLPIIDPVANDFDYANHMRFVQIATEEICFAKYLPQDDVGRKTHSLLSFSEIERATLIDSINPAMASMHHRLNQALHDLASGDDATDKPAELVDLLLELKSSMYKI